jgi:hypothetical protein
VNQSIRAFSAGVGTFVIVYAILIAANSGFAAMYGTPQEYVQSRILLEITAFSRLAMHLAPAIVIGYSDTKHGWKLACLLSLLIELPGIYSGLSKAGFPYVGDPFSTILTFICLSGIAAKCASFYRQAKKIPSSN